jgi:glycosyltransferase involved in cell wall biosynthesis
MIPSGQATEPHPYSESNADFKVTVCICTRNRPLELERALRSVEASEKAVHQVVVADDSDDTRSRTLVDRRFHDTVYVVGAHCGLGANRNKALGEARGSHVIFLDDDAELDSDFITKVYRRLQNVSANQRHHTIITGTELRAGIRVYPNDQSLLGFQSRRYKNGEPLRTVVINATLFPKVLFDKVYFDPELAYGYDEVDLTTRALAQGFVIVPCFDAINRHNPSLVNRDEYRPVVNASRLYVTLKRRKFTEHSPIRAWLGFAIGLGHVFATSMRHHGPSGIRRASAIAFRSISSYRRLDKSTLGVESTEEETNARRCG